MARNVYKQVSHASYSVKRQYLLKHQDTLIWEVVTHHSARLSLTMVR